MDEHFFVSDIKRIRLIIVDMSITERIELIQCQVSFDSRKTR